MAVMLEMEMPKYCLEAIGENYRVVKICPIRELCIRKWRSYIGALNVHSDACPLVELSSQDNSWHTGTPTEEGWYLIAYLHKDRITYRAVKYYLEKGLGMKFLESEGGIPYIDIWKPVAYQKIEPYKGEANGKV